MFDPDQITVTADQTPTVPPPYIPVSGPMPLVAKQVCPVCDGRRTVLSGSHDGCIEGDSPTTMGRYGREPCYTCDETGVI